MKMKVLSICLMSTFLATAPVVSSAPGGSNKGAESQFRSYSDIVSASFYDGKTNNYVYGRLYDAMNGENYVSIQAQHYSYMTGDYWYISCNRPANGNEVSVNNGNGKSSLKATLDPANPQCYSYNVAAPIVIDITGQANGKHTNSSHGQGKRTNNGETWKYTNQNHNFSIDVTGSVGSMDGPWSNGSSSSSRNRNVHAQK